MCFVKVVFLFAEPKGMTVSVLTTRDPIELSYECNTREGYWTELCHRQLLDFPHFTFLQREH